jgi:hypothetical protein
VFTVEQAYSRYVTRAAQYLGTGGMQPLEDDLNIELGYCYDSPAIVGEGGPACGHENPRDSKGRPGTRAPHVWLEQNGKRISTLDLIERNFVVLAGPRAADLTAPGVDFHRIGAPEFLTAYGIGPEGAVLVRPDGFIAWRAQDPREVSNVLASILGPPQTAPRKAGVD